MGKDWYEIHYFYGHNAANENKVMQAMDNGGITHWRSLTPDKQDAMVNRARSGLPGQTDLKHVFKFTAVEPEGREDVGGWWQTQEDPENFYARLGFTVSLVGIEGRPPIREAKP